MRCPDCNKFVPYGEPELDGSAEVNETTVTTTCEVQLTCGECGTYLKSASVEGETEFEGGECKHAPHDEETGKYDDPDHPHVWKVDDETFDSEDRTEGKGRGMRTFYGYHATIKLSCIHDECTETREVEVTADEQASNFDEC